MHNTRGLGRIFWHPLTLKPGAPLAHFAMTVETEDPYRISVNTLVLRLPLTTRAVAVGLWEKEAIDDEDKALLLALHASSGSPLDDSGHITPEFERRLLDDVDV